MNQTLTILFPVDIIVSGGHMKKQFIVRIDENLIDSLKIILIKEGVKSMPLLVTDIFTEFVNSYNKKKKREKRYD